MSYTALMAIYPSEKVEPIRELSNSYGSAPPVWEAMASRYLNVTESYGYPNPGYMQLGDKLWDLWKRNDIPLSHRMVFMLTFDRAYVAKADYAEMALAIRQFLKDFPPHPGHANHWNEIAALLESDPEYPGIGLWCTSVSENPFLGEWNEEREDYDPPDWRGIYSICDALKSPAGPVQPIDASPARESDHVRL